MVRSCRVLHQIDAQGREQRLNAAVPARGRIFFSVAWLLLGCWVFIYLFF